MTVTSDDGRFRLSELCHEISGKRNLILASNRGPIDYHINEGGKLQGHRGSGGVVTALSAISQFIDVTWISSAMGPGDRQAAEMAQGKRFRASFPGHNLYLRFVVSSGSIYHKFYSVICNPLLWFLQHYMWNSSHTPNIDARVHDAWDNGYVRVNRTIAEAVVDEALSNGVPPVVMLHDYHLYLAAGLVREQVPNALIQHFTHIPWPETHYWQLLPKAIREGIYRGMCASDIVGMQTRKDVNNFLHSCEAFVEGAEVDFKGRTVRFGDHVTRVNHYPVSVDTANLRRITSSPLVQEYREKLHPFLNEKTIVRVDRLEPSKNIVRGFRAYDLLFQRYPQLQGKVTFLALLVPSRMHIRQYRRYSDEVNEAISVVNSKYGDEEWQPIRVLYENNYAQALAGMCYYDVLMVNSVIDGMNLVAKEGPIVNTRNGVLVLSETAGACEQLGEHALVITPTDLEGTAEALYRALTMSEDEKTARAEALKRSIEREDITEWLYRQLKDVIELSEEQEQLQPAILGSVPHQVPR